MPADLAAAARFLTTTARLLERRRFALLFAGGSPGPVLAALAAYRNPDGGYGAIEPDLRDTGSQPVGAMHAFEVFEDVAPVTAPAAAALCDWLAGVTLPGGGLPFALPVADATGCAPFWATADPAAPSLHITAAVTAVAVRVARHDPGLAGHPWLTSTTRWCLDAIAAADRPSSTLELLYCLHLLDALGPGHPDARALADRWAAVIPASGELPVEGGLPDERVRPLVLSPRPDSLVRGHLKAEVVAADLDRLERDQRDDGGWRIDFQPYSPAAALEWNGYLTVESLRTLRANGRLD